jgi:magnesium-transporting ATPase (P-type)
MAAEFPKHPFLLSVEETAEALGTDMERGLTETQVARLKEKYPLNELDIGGTISWYRILMKQVLNAMIIVSLVFRRKRWMVYIYTYISYIYKYIFRERERERERD